MKKVESKKSNPKIILLVIAMNVFAIVLLIAFLFYVQNIKRIIYTNFNTQFQDEITRMIDLESKQIITAMESDASWNDFVDYTKTKDKNWFFEMYSNPKTYKSDYIGVYGIDNKIIDHSNDSKIKVPDFIPEKALLFLKKVKKARFYLKTNDGLVEVFGATITGASDSKKLKPAGYFILARLIDNQLKQSVEKITNSKISFSTNPSLQKKQEYQLYFNADLKDYQGKFITRINFERPFGLFIKTIFNTLFGMLFVVLVFFTIGIIYTKKWVYNPIKSITKALETGDKKSIETLKNTEGDFKNIGQLFEESSRQKKELVNAKLKAEESDKLKSSFLANLSHEIRTPMNAIVGFTDLLLHTEVPKEEQQEYLSVIDKSGKNLISIIDDLIEMSKIESQKIIPNYTAVNIETCIHDLYESIQIAIKKTKKIDFKIIETKNPARHPIKTDEVKLKQIIVNLVTNAIKFTEKGSVSFGYEIDELNKAIKFSVKDTGFGIEEKNQKYIFDRFRRVGGDQSIKAGGLGLGLAISKAYVEMLNGTIELDSKLNQGSVFTFTIPLEYIKTKKITVQSINQIKAHKGAEEGTILIAEDDNINFLLFQKIMKTKNFKIIRAENGQVAVDICLSNPNIDLVLMDIKMPIMDGYEAFDKIHPIRPNLPIIAQTAFSSNEDKEKIYKVGFNNYITKPINREKLFEIIDEIYKNKKTNRLEF
ncbi:hybrid sensor histidine kinase/response regulator [Flavobacterium sp. N3904]|uniref:ATP-binding response regulator n=1 Tax=Flavobacterium sp. N3904 TaxID=2986835 RepID=UPI0022245141|nr:ATP-binding protein [Flavobacterium sp. N3904]